MRSGYLAAAFGLLVGATALYLTETFHWAYLSGVGAALWLFLRINRDRGGQEDRSPRHQTSALPPSATK